MKRYESVPTTKTYTHYLSVIVMIGLICGMGFIMAGCAPSGPAAVPTAGSPTEAPPAGASPSASVYQEAPMLAEQVAAGTLPPVDQRLPQNPMLIQPEERVGIYGGVWHLAMVEMDTLQLRRTIGYESLVRWDKGWTKVVPNVAQAYEVSPDSKVFTFKLRQGLKWSDGWPFTADDVVFWYEAIYLNDELHEPLVDSRFDVGKDKLEVEKLDDYTVVFRYAEPQGLFLQNLATLWGAFPTHFPRHYLEQFHKAYNPDVDKLVAQAGVKDWVELFEARQELDNPALPSLFAWTLEPGSVHADGTPAAVVTAVRNPYYWKIDTEYQQLPYIDRLEFKVVATRDEILPLVQAGEVDMQDRNIPPAAALPENQAQGGYGLFKLVSSFSNYMAISFNLTSAEPVKREIFRNKDFRIGLSYAINRQAIIKAANLNAKPYQVAPLPGTPFYNEQMATQYLEYDVKLAKEYLDRAGYSQRDADGFRLGPDGKRISFTMLVPTPIPVGNVDVHLPLIQADWKAVGIELTIEIIPRADAEIRWDNNDYDVTVWCADGGFDAILAPRYYVPAEWIWSQQGPLWAKWYLNSKDIQAEEPPAPVKETITLYRQILQTADLEQQNKLMSQIIGIAAEQFQVMGIHEVPILYGIVKPNFHNVPPLMFSSANYPQPGPTNPCQYFIDPQTE